MAATRSAQLTRMFLLLAALLVPTLSLVPLGGWLLWEKGWLMYWAIGALLFASVVAALEWRIFRIRPAVVRPDSDECDRSQRSLDELARQDVHRIARSIDIEQLQGIRDFEALGIRTLEAVASRLRPGESDVLWQFTMPEAFAILEQVSRRMGVVVEAHIPFGDRLTLAQVRAAYRWRGALSAVEKAYDVWRVLRLANPATALTHEARERLSKAMVNWGREHVTRRLAEEFVEELGRAAIDLYGGRLRSSDCNNGKQQVMQTAINGLGGLEEPAHDSRRVARTGKAAARQAWSALVKTGRTFLRRSKRS